MRSASGRTDRPARLFPHRTFPPRAGAFRRAIWRLNSIRRAISKASARSLAQARQKSAESGRRRPRRARIPNARGNSARLALPHRDDLAPVRASPHRFRSSTAASQARANAPETRRSSRCTRTSAAIPDDCRTRSSVNQETHALRQMLRHALNHVSLHRFPQSAAPRRPQQQQIRPVGHRHVQDRLGNVRRHRVEQT